MYVRIRAPERRKNYRKNEGFERGLLRNQDGKTASDLARWMDHTNGATVPANQKVNTAGRRAEIREVTGSFSKKRRF
jgi:hypothetical protein